MNILCLTCFEQKRTNTENPSRACTHCGERVESFETREEMIEALKDTKFILNKPFYGINSFSASEYVWSDLENQRRNGRKVFSISQQSKNSVLTKMEIGVQFLELAKQNVLKKAS